MRKVSIAVLGIVVALVVLVNGASAENMDVSPSYQSIPYADDFATYDVRIYDIYKTSEHTIKASITVCGSGNNNDLQFKFTNRTGASSGWVESGVSWNWGTPAGKEETITMYVRAKSGVPPNNDYRFFVEDVSGIGEGAGGTVAGNSIPEFTTIAVPVGIALLFAVFYLRKKGGNNRK